MAVGCVLCVCVVLASGVVGSADEHSAFLTLCLFSRSRPLYNTSLLYHRGRPKVTRKVIELYMYQAESRGWDSYFALEFYLPRGMVLGIPIPW